MSLWNKLKSNFSKTQSAFVQKVKAVFLGEHAEPLETLLPKLEELLLSSDVGMITTKNALEFLKHQSVSKDQKALNFEQCVLLLKEYFKTVLEPVAIQMPLLDQADPFMLLCVGVNGAGKTTLLAKLSHYWSQQQKSCLLVAGDTFRAAAAEQLIQWGKKINVPVIAQKASNADPAAVLFDGLSAAAARGIQLVLADTSGRLQQPSLAEELKKIQRVLKKLNPHAPQEVLLVLDATNGQNLYSQVAWFHEALGITGLAVTKLDGSAKGGALFGLAQQFKIPIRWISFGETLEDLAPFNPEAFVDTFFLNRC